MYANIRARSVYEVSGTGVGHSPRQCRRVFCWKKKTSLFPPGSLKETNGGQRNGAGEVANGSFGQTEITLQC
jgi:hypothetical protein